MKPEESKKRGAPPFKANWVEVNWDLPNATLARTHKVSTSTVERNRLRFGRPRPQKLIDWTNVDWSKSNAALCRQLGVSTVSKYRQIHAPETIPCDKASRLHEIDWENVDWSIPTGKLAVQLGIRRNRLYNLRCQYAPHTVASRRKIPNDLNLDWSLSDLELARLHNIWPVSVRIRRRSHAPETIQFDQWPTINWSDLSNQEIIDQTGASWPTVQKYRKVYAPDTVRDGRGRPCGSIQKREKRHRWETIDWCLSNKEIMELTKTSLPTVIKYRKTHAPETVRNRPGRPPRTS